MGVSQKRDRRRLAPLKISPDDRKILESWARRPTTSQRLAFRAKVVLLAGEGKSISEIANLNQSTRVTVSKWRQQYLDKGVDGLHDEPRPGPPRTIEDWKVEQGAHQDP